MVVEHLYNLIHRDNRSHGEPVLGLNLLLCGSNAALANLHAIQAHNEALNLDVSRSGDLGVSLVDRLARSGYILNHNHAVAVLGLIAQKIALIGAVILGLLAVAAVLDFAAVQLVVCNGGNHSQWNTLVGRSKKHVKVVAKVIVNGLRIVLTQALELAACYIGTSIHKERRLTATLKRELTKLEHVRLDHELDKFFFVGFHTSPFRVGRHLMHVNDSRQTSCRLRLLRSPYEL